MASYTNNTRIFYIIQHASYNMKGIHLSKMFDPNSPRTFHLADYPQYEPPNRGPSQEDLVYSTNVYQIFNHTPIFSYNTSSMVDIYIISLFCSFLEKGNMYNRAWLLQNRGNMEGILGQLVPQFFNTVMTPDVINGIKASDNNAVHGYYELFGSFNDNNNENINENNNYTKHIKLLDIKSELLELLKNKEKQTYLMNYLYKFILNHPDYITNPTPTVRDEDPNKYNKLNMIISFEKNYPDSYMFYDIKYTDNEHSIPTSIFADAGDESIENIRRFISIIITNGLTILITELYKMLHTYSNGRSIKVVPFSCTETPLNISQLLIYPQIHDHFVHTIIQPIYQGLIQQYAAYYSSYPAKNTSNRFYSHVCMTCQNNNGKIRETYEPASDFINDYMEYLKTRGVNIETPEIKKIFNEILITIGKVREINAKINMNNNGAENNQTNRMNTGGKKCKKRKNTKKYKNKNKKNTKSNKKHRKNNKGHKKR